MAAPSGHPWRPRFQLTAAQRYEVELAALGDSARLAHLWDHALRASFELGRATGYRAGWLDGRGAEAGAWQAIMTGYSELMTQPMHAELVRRRRPSNDPCRVACGQCSQCIRAAAVRSNLARYGQPDYPGTAADNAASAQADPAPDNSFHDAHDTKAAS